MIDLIASDELDAPQVRGRSGLNFFKFRGDQDPKASFFKKAQRICGYYAKLMHYAATCEPKIFHILWNNRFQFFDRTLLMLYYKLLGKHVVMTTHNVNQRRRDGSDTRWNRLTLQIQYRLADRIFVHTEKMKAELVSDFGVPPGRVTVIPFGINNAVPHTSLTEDEAKRRIGVRQDEKTILFFGRIDPYKGLEYLVDAFKQLTSRDNQSYRLVIAGKPEEAAEEYFRAIREDIRAHAHSDKVVLHAYHIPDEETEVHFKAADVLVLPYRGIYQSGVLFLAHSFGLPVVAADGGSLKDDIVEGQTGFIFKSGESEALTAAIERYFASDLYADLSRKRGAIIQYANQKHSWDVVGQETMKAYARLLQKCSPEILLDREASTTSSL